MSKAYVKHRSLSPDGIRWPFLFRINKRKKEKIMRNEVKAILKKLETVRDKVSDYLDTAESADSPDEERIDRLQHELDCLETAIEAIEDID